MGPVGVMIGDVLVQQPSQMSLIQHDHMIQEVAPYAAHPTLCNSVLPWAAESGADRLAAHRFHAGDDIGTELRVPIKKQESLRRLALLPRFAQLYRNPKRLRVRSHVAGKDSTAIVCDHQEAVQDVEREGWYRKEIHGRDGLAMVTQEG